MNNNKKGIISVLCVILVLTSITINAFAQDPFTGIAIGGLGGASAGGLFGSMAGLSGIQIGYTSDPVNDAMWNRLNSDSVYFSGEKHEATMVGEDIYDYITVDIGDWLQAQNDFIDEFVSTYQVEDNDSGNTTATISFEGVPFVTTIGGRPASLPVAYCSITKTAGYVTSMNYGRFSIQYTMNTARNMTINFYDSGNLIYTATTTDPPAGERQMVFTAWNAGSQYLISLCDKRPNQGYVDFSYQVGTATEYSIPYTSTTVDTSVFDNWESATIKIPHNESGLNPEWTVQEFLEAINNAWANHTENTIIITETVDPPVPPQPIPDIPLGEIPFDDWVDLWGQSIDDLLNHVNEKADLIVIGQEDIQDGIDDLIGLNTNIDENIEDMIVYQGEINDNVEDIAENVEDIEDEVIVIVDELGNVVDVLEGIEAEQYAQGETLDDIGTDIGTLVTGQSAISTDVSDIADNVDDIKDAVVPYVPLIPQIKTAIDTQTATETQIRDAVTSQTTTITQSKDAIIQSIRDQTTTLTNDIPNITEICENIDEAPLKDIDTGLDRLPSILNPYLIDLRDALGIWHYVVEWVGSINSTFSFIVGVLSGTAIMTPIYAAIAGHIVIKVYRRFGA